MSAAEINALKSRVGDLMHQLSEAKNRLREAEIAAAPVKVGDIVSCCGVEHRVTEVIPSYSKVWVKGNPKKKDGTWGIAVRALYSDWQLVSQTV
tara:strand:- start:3596 stop:3877 length:282 start_codon:yes stop_codon:yes gene_type:complete